MFLLSHFGLALYPAKADFPAMPVFTPQDAAIHARKAHAHRAESSLAQLCEMQGALRADILSDDIKPAERAMSMRAYIEAEKLKRIIKGQPANTSQSIREPREKKQSKSSASPLESLPESKPE